MIGCVAICLVALVLSALVMLTCWACEAVRAADQLEARRAALHFEQRFCGECERMVKVDVWQSNTIADVVCSECGEIIDVVPMSTE